MKMFMTLLAVSLISGMVGAADTEQAMARGLEIAREAELRDTGFENYTADLTMVLRNRHGQESERALSTRILELTEDGDKSLIVFSSPADVDGTALLTFSHKTGDDDQWLYLPALKRVKRISSSNKSGPFVGSEFAYEDLSSQEVEEYTYRFLREETVNALPMFVVERFPVDERSGYSKQVAWRDSDEYRLHRVDFYDRKGELLKTLKFLDYQQYVDRYWRPDRMEMVNHQTGKSTDLQWTDYQFGLDLQDGDFNRAALARVR